MKRIRFSVGVVASTIAAGVLLVPLGLGGAHASTPFTLAFDGVHSVDSGMPAGLRHEGRFTAAPPFCPAGRAYDVGQTVGDGFLNVRRLHTCDDGTGSFTAYLPAARAEHGENGGSGTWQIVEGTGRYAALRGLGTYTATLVSGNPDVFETIVYTTSWQGTVGFDADPPAIDSYVATARKVRQRPRTYALRVTLAARDATGPVSYTVDVRAGRTPLELERGTTPSGRATIALRLRPPRGAVSVQVVVGVRDALGNETTGSRTVRLR